MSHPNMPEANAQPRAAQRRSTLMLIFALLFGTCLLIVLFFATAGPMIMNLLAHHDPNAIRHDRASTLAAIHHISQNGIESHAPSSNPLALDHGVGPGRVNCLIRGAEAEKAGRPAEAFLWFALDAQARGMTEAVIAYEAEALRLSTASPLTHHTDSLAAILPEYPALKRAIQPVNSME